MTNEEKKSNEIAAEYLSGHDRFEITYEEMREAVMEMAEWKDQQFKKYLEKKLKIAEELVKKLQNNVLQNVKAAGMFYQIHEIINELFGETEQDNSDREE